MPRITSKQSRRLGLNLSGREKDGFVKRPYPPGRLDSEKKHKSNRSEFGEQLRAKQILRITYGLREKQFSNLIFKAMSKKGVNTEQAIFTSLESRLDNVVYRMGLANTRALARQLVNHGHITVNGKRLDIPSHSIESGDKVAVREGSKPIKYFAKLAEKFEPTVPAWLKLDAKALSAEVVSLPKEMDKTLNYQTIIEFYSR